MSPEEGARHWYDTVFAPILEILQANGALRLLASMTDADRFLLFRRGLDGPMDTDWRIPAWAIEGGMANVRGSERRRGMRDRLGPLKRTDRPVELLSQEPRDP